MTGHDLRPPVADPVAGPVRPSPHRAGRAGESDGDGRAGILLIAAMVAMALVAGLNYTFAVAVMPNMAGADDRTFVETMQRFNENPVFPLTFTVALVLTAWSAVLQRRHGSRAAMRWALAALALYAVVIAITGGVHLPLNDEIVRAGDPGRIADLAHVRDRFEGPWVAANVVRTLFCTAAVAALGRALQLYGRPEDGPGPGGRRLTA